MKRPWIGLVVCAVAALSVWPSTARAQATQRYALVVQGASGGEEYAAQHRKWVDALVSTLKDKLHFDAAHLIVLTETPQAGEEHSSEETVKAAFGRLAKVVTPKDVVFIMLIGHGSAEGTDAKFNLPGPDLSAAEWAALVKPLPGSIVFVDATSASSPFLAAVAGPNHIVITATNSPAQKYDTVFAQGFIDALGSPEADLDKNGRVSMWEAFVYASHAVANYYTQKGTMQTEHSVLDDNGDGTGRAADAAGKDGVLSSTVYLDTPAVPASTDPAVRALLERRQELLDKLDELKRQQSGMPADEYTKQSQQILIDLATVSAELRKHGIGG